jgi:Zn-dependent peptidase ImmA (M78 family)
MNMKPEARAQTVLVQLKERKAPINVLRVARQLGVRVERADLGEDCSGVLVRKGDAAVIGVNYSHHPNRQRFTIAHELGHFVLHKGDKYTDKGMTTLQFRNAESSTGTQNEEREANQFAAALLMPGEWVRREFEKHPFDLGDDEALNSMCRLFGVSSQAMSFRLGNLGLLREAFA